MTLAEIEAAIDGDSWRRRERMKMTAIHAAWTINVHIPRNRPRIRPQQLLGPEYFEDERRSIGKQREIRTAEDWKKHMDYLRQMSAFSAKVVQQVKAGKRKTERARGMDIVGLVGGQKGK